MLKVTAYRLLSTRWRPHSEQLKQWMVGAASCKGMQLARTYMHNLKLDEVVEEMDDCCELVGLMQECGYPVGGRHDRWIRSFIAMNADSIGPQLVVDITKRLETHPNSFTWFRSTFFSEPNFISRVRDIFTALPQEDFASFLRVFWGLACSFQDLPSDLEPLVYAFSSSISTSLRTASNPFPLMLALADCNLPLLHSSLNELSMELNIASKKLTQEEIQLIIDLIAAHGHFQHKYWVFALQQSYLNGPLSTDTKEKVVYLMKVLAHMKTEPIPQIVQFIVTSVPQLSVDELLSIARSIHQYSPNTQAWTGLTNVLNSVEKRIDIDMSSKISSLDMRAQLIACLSQLNLSKATPLLLDLLLSCNDSPITTKDIANICITMNSIEHYPVEAAILCKASLDLEMINQDEAIHILYAFTRLGIAVNKFLAKKAHGKFTKRGFTYRKRDHQSKPSVYRDSLILLVVSMVHLRENEELKEVGGIALDLLDKNPFDREEKIVLLSKLKDLGASSHDIRKNIVMNVISSLDNDFSLSEYQLILETLSDLGIRDSNAFEKVLKFLKESKPSLNGILCAAKAAHKLHLIPQFEASNIFEAYDSLSECDTENVFLLMRLCTPIQRGEIIKHTWVRSFLNQVDLNSISTADLLIMFNSPLSERKPLILEQLLFRTPLKENDITAEEVIIALEELRKDTLVDNFEGVFRVGSRALQKVNESQLMRILNCVKHLPRGPNIVYRVMGNVLLKMVDKISVDCVIMWLWLYFEGRVRDDGVGRALVRKALKHSLFLSKETGKKLQDAAQFYGVTHDTRTHNRGKKKQQHFVELRNF